MIPKFDPRALLHTSLATAHFPLSCPNSSRFAEMFAAIRKLSELDQFAYSIINQGGKNICVQIGTSVAVRCGPS